MKKYILDLISLLPGHWLRNFFLISFLTSINALFEVLSIGLIIPFISVFVNKTDFIKENYFFFSNLNNEYYILIILGAFIIIFLLKNIILLIANKKKINFSHDLNIYLTKKLFNKYTNRKLDFYIHKKSSEIIRNLLIETHHICFGVIVSIFNLFTQALIFFAIFIFLMIYNPLVTFIVSLVMISLGSLIIFFQQKKLKLFNLIRQEQQEKLLKNINETLGNITQIILSKMQIFFTEKFVYHLKENAKVGKLKDFYFIIPKPSLEVLVVIMLFSSVVFLIRFNYSLEDVFIILGVFTFSSVRLIPALSTILQSIQNLRNQQTVVSLICDELNDKKYENQIFNNKNDLKLKKIKFNIIKFKNLNFKYSNNDYLFKDINFSINRGEKIGIIGTTGSGKTTFVNLLIGLLTPSKGQILLDNVNLNYNLNDWQKSIGYVSQNTFLADETLLFNITFQALDEPIDIHRCNYLIKLMELEKLVRSKNNGLKFIVGEKGVKLSGGQLQRIGIARALYKIPEILILDEATNALDIETQNRILNNVYNETINKTVISISHDFKALKNCDKVFSISKNEFVKF